MIVALTVGHGGVFNQRYLTAGKQSPDGLFREGEYTRAFASRFSAPRFVFLNPGPVGIPTQTRQQMVDHLCAYFPMEQVVHLEIHTNASSGAGWSRARGHRLFPGRSVNSRRLAKHLDSAFRLGPYTGVDLPKETIKKRVFSALSANAHAAVLIELGFHTNRDDVELLTMHQRKFVAAIRAALLAYEGTIA